MHSPLSRLRKTITVLTLVIVAIPSLAKAADKAKNVILMIGDGMGPQQIGLLESYARLAPNSLYNGQETGLQKLAKESVLSLSMTYPVDALVVDSACSASHLATGQMAPLGALGLDTNGDSVETILEKAKRLGKATGLVSDTRITHATPAAFASHQPYRFQENAIAVDMLETGVDVMLSGGLRHWIPQSVNENGEVYGKVIEQTGGKVKIDSMRTDERNLLSEAHANGYQLAFDRTTLAQTRGDKLLGLFANSEMMDGITHSHTKNSANRQEPSLKEMAMKALDILSQDNDGFFLMVEGGQIDWAGHQNDAGTLLHEMLKFDEAVAAVHEWVKNRNDTLLLVTADHETGSFGFSFYTHNRRPKPKKLPGKGFATQDYQPIFNFGSHNILDKLHSQSKSFKGMIAEYQELPLPEQTAANLVKIVNANSAFPITEEGAERILETEPNPHSKVPLNLIGRELAVQQSVVWGTNTHTSTPVTVIAYGDSDLTENFKAIQHHTDVGKKLMNAF